MANMINDNELEKVSGGWQYANGTYTNYGNYIVYTVAPGDVLSGIAQRFGVSYMQIAQWNGIKNPDIISIGQNIHFVCSIIPVRIVKGVRCIDVSQRRRQPDPHRNRQAP